MSEQAGSGTTMTADQLVAYEAGRTRGLADAMHRLGAESEMIRLAAFVQEHTLGLVLRYLTKHVDKPVHDLNSAEMLQFVRADGEGV
jgi:hypothetical protein